MADVELRYGPGASLTILKSGLGALRLKAKLEVEIEEVEDGMDDALSLHLGQGAGQEGAQRVQRLLQMCIRNLSGRQVNMSADLGEETEVLELAPGQPAGDYKTAIDAFYTRVADHHRDAAAPDS